MKALLSRCALKRSIGLVIDDKAIAVSVVATTPLGRQEVFRDTHPVGDEVPQAVVERLLFRWIKKGRGKKPRPGVWVQLGVPESQVFQAVVPITSANLNSPPQSYFLEAVQSTNLRAEERLIELQKVELNKLLMACVAASPRAAIVATIAILDALGTRIGRAEPAPAALYRAGTFHKKNPRGARLTARFFLGEHQAIGVLAAGQQPLFWHTFDLPAGDEANAILAANSTLWMLGRHSRINLPIDTVIVHGRPTIEIMREPEAFRQRTGARLIRCAEPDYSATAAAMGAALANPLTNEAGHDLARTLKPPVSIRDIFPWGELALHGVLLIAVSLFLHGAAGEVNARLKAVRTQLTSFSWIKNQDQSKLEAEKKALQGRLKVLEAFKGSRVGWSAVLRTVAAAEPENTTIKGLTGEAEVEATAKAGMNKPKKQLIVNFATPMSEDGSVPREIDGFLAALRGEPMIKRHFPLIEVSGLKANPSKRGEQPFASYSIVCLPKAEGAKTSVP
jgi:hypothetical protein